MPTAPFEKGDRIRLVEMPNDPDPIPVGTTGTVKSCEQVGFLWHILMDWDIKRSLALCIPPDHAVKI